MGWQCIASSVPIVPVYRTRASENKARNGLDLSIGAGMGQTNVFRKHVAHRSSRHTEKCGASEAV